MTVPHKIFLSILLIVLSILVLFFIVPFLWSHSSSAAFEACVFFIFVALFLLYLILSLWLKN